MNDAARYDALLEAGREPLPPCPVCTGDEDAEPCSQECGELIARCERKQRIVGLFLTARSALAWARVYVSETAANDPRAVECLRRAQDCRREIRYLREANAASEYLRETRGAA